MEEQVISGRYITHRPTLRAFLIETYGNQFEVYEMDGGATWKLRVPRGRKLNVLQVQELQNLSQKAVLREREKEEEERNQRERERQEQQHGQQD